MLNLLELPYLILLISTLVISLIGFIGLIYINKSPRGIVRKIFYISARKSNTNAVQLGGLPLSISVVLSLSVLLSINNNNFINIQEGKIITYWIYSAIFIISYGYLDDKLELRPVIKLFLQTVSVFFFAILTANILNQNNAHIAFVITCVFGIAVINGTNLLDGLDTLSIKSSMVIYGAFLFFAFKIGTPTLAICTIICSLPVMSFYIFNKEPSKIHLGEIGGCFIGFSYLLLSALLYNSYQKVTGGPSALGYCLLPLSLPLLEISISFLRRVYNKKSPFRGDKFHVHHILTHYHHHSHSKAANIMALSLLGIFVITIGSTYLIHPLLAFGIAMVLEFVEYIIIAGKYWQGSDHLKLSPHSILDFIRRKDVKIIDSSKIDDFHLSIVSSEGKDSNIKDDAKESDKRDKSA